MSRFLRPHLLRQARYGLRRVLAGARANAPNWFYLRHHIKRYQPGDFQSDCHAGLNTALLALPQGMAFAAIAGLPLTHGIISAAISALVAPLFSSSRYTALGPTNATALMVFSYFLNSSELTGSIAFHMPLLLLLAGGLCVIGSYLKVAELLQYVSRSVMVGYITGAAILIFSNQAQHFFGLQGALQQLPAAKNFFTQTQQLFQVLPQLHWPSLLIGTVTLSAYLLLRKHRPKWPNFALVLTLVSAMSAALAYGIPSFRSIATFQNFRLSDLQLAWPDLGEAHLLDHISQLGGLAIALAFLTSLENTVMAKTLGSKTGDRPDVNQDMFSVGMTNIANAFVGGMPASGSLTRSALNFEAGAKSPVASIITGLVSLLGILLLSSVPLIGAVPKACLAALVMGVALSLFNLRALRICYFSTTADAAVLITTLIATLMLRLDYAIFIGVSLSLILFLRKASQPYLVEYEVNSEGELRAMRQQSPRPMPAISIVHVEGNLFFGAAELFQSQIQRTFIDPQLKVIILRLRNARHLDATSVSALEQLIGQARSLGRHILVSGITIEVYRVLKNSGVLKVLQEGCEKGQSNLFRQSVDNPNYSTRRALLRAQELLGTKEAEIKIFVDQNKQKP